MAKKQKFDYDLIVIGSGAGGSAAATIAARAGKKVAVVEGGTFGGESPNFGDVPLRALLRAAHLYDDAKHGNDFGIRSSSVSYNYPSLMAWKDTAIKRTGAGGNRKYYENEGVTTIKGLAHFLTPHEISVNRKHLSAANFLIASGAHWDIPTIPGIETVKYLTPKTLLQTTRPPKSLVIIGGGSVSVEIAQLMATFGTKVHIIEVSNHLLPNEDDEVSESIERVLTNKKGVSILTQAKVLALQKENIAKRVTYSRGGQEHSIRTDEILIATNRVPTVDFGLDNATVVHSPKGIEVNAQLQTSARHIYAAGDVLGHDSYTHSALMESRIAVNNILHRQKATPDYTATPRLTFTSPEVASVGLNEYDCIKRDLGIKKAIAPLSIIARSNTDNFRDGFVKLITDHSGTVLGGTIVAPHASEMIHEIALAVKHRLTAADLATTPHAFLSWSEAIRVAAAKLS